ncbi:MAG: hypothetical protein J6T87_04495 [Bacteroidales bacterium]|nr:hypothetical protein [Bacteroidales bacterium]
MKKFLLKTLLFAFVLLVMAVVFDMLLTTKALRLRTSPFATWNDLYQRDIDAQVLIMGSSRAFVQFNPAIIDSILHINSYNLGMNGRAADSQILKYKVFRHRGNPKPKLIVYEVSHGTMQKSNGYEREQFVPYLHDPYLWQLCHEQEDFSFADFVLPSWRFLGRQNLIRKILFPSVKSEYDSPLYKGFRSYDRKWGGRGLHQQASVSYTHDTTIIRQFRDFLSECRRDSIQVVLVTSPFYIGGTRKMADSTGMHAMFAQIATDFNIPFLDYTYDELSYDTAYFYNTMHLNKIGADLFSQKVARDIGSVMRGE